MNKTGCLLRPSNTRNYKFPVCDVSDKDLPSTFILSDERIPTVRNQGNIGACVGHGIAEVLGILYGLEFGKEKLISPWYIYGNPECRDGFTGYGMFLCDAIEGVRKCGSVPLEDFDVRLEVPDIITAVKNRSELTDKAKPYRIKSYIEIPCYALVSKRKSALKQALYTYKLPIVIASANYFGGGHCVILIGWDEKDRFIFQNSWGTGYKDNGRYYIPTEEIDEAYVLLDEILELPYKDVPEDEWYYKDIKTAYFSGIINGTSSSSFEPDINILRAEAAAIALRVLNNTQDSIDTYARSQQQNNKNIAIPELVSDIDTNKICPDLDKNEWYYDEVTKLLATGIMQGDETGLFRPNDNITRAETAVIAVKLYEYVRDNLKVQNVGKLNSVTLTDIYPTDWFYEVVRAAAGYGLITGDSEGTFRPYDNITRAEFTAIIIRVMKNIDDMLISLCEV